VQLSRYNASPANAPIRDSNRSVGVLVNIGKKEKSRSEKTGSLILLDVRFLLSAFCLLLSANCFLPTANR
jgi:hypothetical protein